MNIRIIICLILFCATGYLPVQAQYFYQDIYRTQQTNREHQQYQKAGVRHIRIKSFDGHHTPSKGFHCTKKLSDDYKQVITKTQSFSTGASTVISLFDDNGRITHTIDSSAMSVTETHYHYNAHDQIDSLVFTSYSDKGENTYLYKKDTFRFQEAHIYQYDSGGRLEKMMRLKSHHLYSTVLFRTDSSGRVTKESEVKKGDTLPPVYYKYNTSGKLTDVFHYNPARQKMAPDYMFDYNEQGRLKEKTTVMINTHQYLLWKYAYTPTGLISQEECYDQKHALRGILKFEYLF